MTNKIILTILMLLLSMVVNVEASDLDVRAQPDIETMLREAVAKPISKTISELDIRSPAYSPKAFKISKNQKVYLLITERTLRGIAPVKDQYPLKSLLKEIFTKRKMVFISNTLADSDFVFLVVLNADLKDGVLALAVPLLYLKKVGLDLIALRATAYWEYMECASAKEIMSQSSGTAAIKARRVSNLAELFHSRSLLQTTGVENRIGIIEGTVTWKRNGHPASNVIVTARDHKTLEHIPGSATTFQDGKYRLEYTWSKSSNPDIYITISAQEGEDWHEVYPTRESYDMYGLLVRDIHYDYEVEVPLKWDAQIPTWREYYNYHPIGTGYYYYATINGVVRWYPSNFPVSDAIVELWIGHYIDENEMASSSYGTRSDGRYQIKSYPQEDGWLVTGLDIPPHSYQIINPYVYVDHEFEAGKSYDIDITARPPDLAYSGPQLVGEGTIVVSGPQSVLKFQPENKSVSYEIVGPLRSEIVSLLSPLIPDVIVFCLKREGFIKFSQRIVDNSSSCRSDEIPFSIASTNNSKIRLEGTPICIDNPSFCPSGGYIAPRNYSTDDANGGLIGALYVKNPNWVVGSDTPTHMEGGDLYITDGREELEVLASPQKYQALWDALKGDDHGPKVRLRGFIKDGQITVLNYNLIRPVDDAPEEPLVTTALTGIVVQNGVFSGGTGLHLGEEYMPPPACNSFPSGCTWLRDDSFAYILLKGNLDIELPRTPKTGYRVTVEGKLSSNELDAVCYRIKDSMGKELTIGIMGVKNAVWKEYPPEAHLPPVLESGELYLDTGSKQIPLQTYHDVLPNLRRQIRYPNIGPRIYVDGYFWKSGDLFVESFGVLRYADEW